MRLTDEDIKDLKELCNPAIDVHMCNLLDTIEALQQENQQLKARLLAGVIDSDLVKTYDGSALDKADRYIDKLEKQNEQLQAQTARTRGALTEAIYTIRAGRLCSIGSINNTYESQISVAGVDIWEQTLSDTPAEFHNPADVATLGKARETLLYYVDCLEQQYDKNGEPCGGGHFDEGRRAKEALAAIAEVVGE
ncbi:MAG: hypothetical protein ABFD25_00805 [Clostridiaceae bacterium]